MSVCMCMCVCTSTLLGWPEPYIFMVYTGYFWQGNHQIYGHIRCIYMVLANPINLTTWPDDVRSIAGSSTMGDACNLDGWRGDVLRGGTVKFRHVCLRVCLCVCVQGLCVCGKCVGGACVASVRKVWSLRETTEVSLSA